tara:strand:- start:122 stop:610 length:489 start_codon:yes stop_codon:yes gene_type:complete
MIKIPRKKVNIECEGSAAVAMALRELGVDYIEKWTDHDCIDIGKLRFDFYLPKYFTALEYDAHLPFKLSYRAKDEAKNKHNLIIAKRRHAIKSLWCKKNNISLLRITSEVAAKDMVDHIDYWLEVYTDRLKVDVKYASEDEDYIKEVGVDQYLEELKQGISN